MAKKHTLRPCRCTDLEARLQRVEELAGSNRRELDIQFRRIADLQAALDSPMADGRRRRSDAKPDEQADSETGGKSKWFWPGGDS